MRYRRTVKEQSETKFFSKNMQNIFFDTQSSRARTLPQHIRVRTHGASLLRKIAKMQNCTLFFHYSGSRLNMQHPTKNFSAAPNFLSHRRKPRLPREGGYGFCPKPPRGAGAFSTFCKRAISLKTRARIGIAETGGSCILLVVSAGIIPAARRGDPVKI